MRFLPFCIFKTALLILTFSASPALSQAPKDRLNLATLSYPPLMHTTPDGSYSGTVGETLRMMCTIADITCHVDLVPFKRAYVEMENGRIDGILTLKFKTFEDCCLSSQWFTPWRAGFFSSLPDHMIPKTADDLRGKSLIIVNGMRSPTLFIPDLEEWEKNGTLQLYRTPSIATAAKMLGSDRADLLWGSEEYYWYFDKLGTRIRWHFTPVVSEPIVIWLRKDKAALMQRLDHAYQQMQDKNMLNDAGVLNDDLMKDLYVEAPFTYE